MPSVRWSRFMNKIPLKTHLVSLISPSMIKITDVITYFSFTVSAFTYINFLYASSENLDGEREGRGYNSR